MDRAESPTELVVVDLLRIGELVNTTITELVDSHIAQWDALGGAVDEHEVLAQYRAMALAGGKRLRPAFTFWAFEGAGGSPDDPRVLDAALAVELLHTFALIHDDVMDEAETRRSVDTIHVTYAQRHEELGLRGDSVRYGQNVAILMGDLAFAHAAELITHLPREVIRLFFAMCADLMVGQYLDLEAAAHGVVPGVSRSDQITELKTARYTVINPLRMGAMIAGRHDELGGPLTAYGRPIGHAFQLRDDLLGVFGDPAITGKPVGDDLSQGKGTRLLELGIEATTGDDQAVLLRLGSPAMQADDPERAASILTECGARKHVEETIDRLVDEAVAVIEAAPLTPRAIELLSGAAVLIAHRDH